MHIPVHVVNIIDNPKPFGRDRDKNSKERAMTQANTSTARTAGKVLVDQLLVHGADTAFCVPGESYL